ncbi:hypothetical protein ONZ45_g8990 [Pleurotus djamor]|nr:hypothetical protein ONZ45_g8990 [Pleurotus djamor]
MKYREHDVEMKALRRRKKNDGDDESVVVQEAKVKQKLWARATARWKANARYTARQRRGKRSVISRSAVAANSTLSLPPSINEASQSSPSLPPSRASSPRPSTSHESHDSHRLAHSSTSRDMQEAQDPTTLPDVSISPPTPTQASPPAYQQPLPRNQRIPEDDMSLSDSLSRKVLRQHSVSSRHPSFTESSTDEAPIGDSLLADDSISYTPSINSAHVATDDKSLLARLGEMASEPPVDHSGSSSLQVSAPVWQDDFAEFPHDGVPQETGASPQSSANSEFSAERNLSAGFPLPPPPISHKGKLAELSYYEHSSYSYDDLVDAHGLEPSAPPFSEAIGPSAPPLDEEQVQVSLGVPSAPPLVDESSEQAGDGDRHTDDDSMSGVLEYVDEEDVLDASHSAGSSAALTPSQVQAAAVALQDSQSSPPSPLTPSTSADYPRHRVSLIESSQDLVANDSVPLPRYQP